MSELRDVKIVIPTPGYDFGWYDEGWRGVHRHRRYAHRRHTGRFRTTVDLHPVGLWNTTRPLLWLHEPDILVTEISPPDSKGFCSFGQSLWNKKAQIREARARGRLVIAEVNEHLMRTFGDNFIHVSEFDYFVEHISSGRAISAGSLGGRPLKPPEPYLQAIAGYVNELIQDGDTLQIGVGRTTEPLVDLGVFDGKRDLGYHSEATAPGIIRLVQEGVITGRHKTLHPGKVVVTSLGGSTREQMEWANANPIFHLAELEYVTDIRTVAANHQMVALNNILAIDLSGQITAESVNGRTISIAGGQVPFVIGALLSEGGRSIHVLPSTAQGGRVSRILPELPAGSVVTVPRYCMDFVVTEHGIARLWGKSLRERADELIAVAHPDFRDELRYEARRRLWTEGAGP
ncbi:MAG: acetyl-CoA hydrolase/transferase C-terminal domain-containing protein [Dehalococcoidia bacterium]